MSLAEEVNQSRISPAECRAMRALDGDEDYSRPEIAFMFECKDETVGRHCDGECAHEGMCRDCGRALGAGYLCDHCDALEVER